MLLHGKKPLVEVNILCTIYLPVLRVTYSGILLVARTDNNMIYRKINQDQSSQFFLYLYFLVALPVNVNLKHDILTTALAAIFIRTVIHKFSVCTLVVQCSLLKQIFNLQWLQVRKRDNEFQVVIERWATYDGDGL